MKIVISKFVTILKRSECFIRQDWGVRESMTVYDDMSNLHFEEFSTHVGTTRIKETNVRQKVGQVSPKQEVVFGERCPVVTRGITI